MAFLLLPLREGKGPDIFALRGLRRRSALSTFQKKEKKERYAVPSGQKRGACHLPPVEKEDIGLAYKRSQNRA